MNATEQFRREVEHLKFTRKIGHHEAWVYQRQMSPQLYADMLAEANGTPAAAALENVDARQASAAHRLANATAIANATSAGPLDEMIPGWAYELAGVSSETLDDFGAAVANGAFPTNRIGDLVSACAAWLQSNRGIDRIAAFQQVRAILPGIFAQDDAANTFRNFTSQNLSGNGDDGVTARQREIAADDARGDFVVSLLPSWAMDALEVKPTTSDLTLEQRVNRRSVSLTGEQARRAFEAAKQNLMARQQISRNAADEKLRKKAYYLYNLTLK
jgi:hypothetical protein